MSANDMPPFKTPLVMTFPCGEQSDLINVRDAEDSCLYGYPGARPGSYARAVHTELIRRANAYDVMVETLRRAIFVIHLCGQTVAPSLIECQAMSTTWSAALARAVGENPHAK